MPDFQVNDVVYAIKTLNEPASGDAPASGLCSFGDELTIRDIGTREGRPFYYVNHDWVEDGRTFGVFSNEISKMKHFAHNQSTFEGWG